MRRLLASIGIFLLFAQGQIASASELKLQVFISEPEEINVTSVLIKGQTEMMVVCAQGTKSAALRLRDEITATGLKLKYILLTHAHLDHSQGAGILKEAFPEARFISSPEIALLQRHRIPLDDAMAKARYGENAAVPSIPAEDFAETELFIDDERIEIWRDIIGDPGMGPPTEPHIAVYVPSLNALMPSDVIYFNGHVMLGGSSSESRKLWVEQIDGWIARGFDIVIPGHMPKTDKERLTALGALQHTRNYIADYDRVFSESSSSDEVIEKMLELYPDTQHRSALYLGTYINFKEFRKLSFDPADKTFSDELTDDQIAKIDAKKFEEVRKLYNP